MSEKELSTLAGQLKQVLSEYVPAQYITAGVGFFPDLNVTQLEMRILIPDDYQHEMTQG